MFFFCPFPSLRAPVFHLVKRSSSTHNVQRDPKVAAVELEFFVGEDVIPHLQPSVHDSPDLLELAPAGRVRGVVDPEQLLVHRDDGQRNNVACNCLKRQQVCRVVSVNEPLVFEGEDALFVVKRVMLVCLESRWYEACLSSMFCNHVGTQGFFNEHK